MTRTHPYTRYHHSLLFCSLRGRAISQTTRLVSYCVLSRAVIGFAALFFLRGLGFISVYVSVVPYHWWHSTTTGKIFLFAVPSL